MIELDIAELLAAIIAEHGGTVEIKSENMARGWSDHVVTVDYIPDRDTYRFGLALSDEVEYEEN